AGALVAPGRAGGGPVPGLPVGVRGVRGALALGHTGPLGRLRVGGLGGLPVLAVDLVVPAAEDGALRGLGGVLRLSPGEVPGAQHEPTDRAQQVGTPPTLLDLLGPLLQEPRGALVALGDELVGLAEVVVADVGALARGQHDRLDTWR